MKKLLILFLLLAIPTTLALEANELYNSEGLQIQNNISNTINIFRESDSAYIDSLTAYLYAFPKNLDGQKIINQQTIPEASFSDSYMKFYWSEPKENMLKLFVSTNIMTKQRFPKIRNKVPFPIVNVNVSKEYLESNSAIDADNPEIIRLANELAEGEDDLYVVENKLADWVQKNIVYNLSTITVESSQSASWVLSNRQGVCDELSTLFIALNRALGIPARFVSGIAYSDYSLFTENWLGHGWAEVYFPDYGWVPFDLTFKEFGFIDPTHIVLEESKDANESSVDYEWRARNVDLKTGKLEFATAVTSVEKKSEPLVTLSVSVMESNVRFGSFNAIEAKIRNLYDFYVPLTLRLGRTESVINHDDRERILLLKPYEEKSVYFLISTDSELNPKYEYTFPITVITNQDIEANTKFLSSRHDSSFTADDFSKLFQTKEEKSEVAKLILTCDAKKLPYIYENVTVKCNLINTGNIFLTDLMICNQKCFITDIGIGKSVNVNFEHKFSEIGEQSIKIKAYNSRINVETSFPVIVQDEPKITIQYNGPSKIKFNEKSNLSINISKLSDSVPEDVNLNFELGGYKKSWKIKELSNAQLINIGIEGSLLNEGKNKILINVDYKDKNNRNYNAKSIEEIELAKLNFWQHISSFFKKLFMKIFS